jgi:hypothetical protein
MGCNAHRIERTYRDVRLDGADHFVALFQLAGRSARSRALRCGRYRARGCRPARDPFCQQCGGVVEYRGSFFAAPVPGFASRIRTAGRPLPA